MQLENIPVKELRAIHTLGELKGVGYQSKSIKDELRSNLIKKLKSGDTVFEGIYGYDDTVIPDLQRAILARHNINLLGLRGQAKTKMARLMVGLLDEYIPAIKGTEIHDDPLNPISRQGRDIIKEHGDETPIIWIHREERYTEKLATPDVTVADLIGDVDPIKAASLKLPYSDERVIHYGLIPRSHRGIFVINELPDLQARIQVALFNILQEGDIQIRGFKLRLPLDIQFVFTANPEDYTNRGSIVTPLKDRIDSQIITHYPEDIEVGKKITKQEANIPSGLSESVHIPELAKDMIEQLAFEARHSEYIDEKSGVSARLTISAYENLLATAERRMLVNGESETQVRIGDLIGVIPAITGKVELVYEGEQEGAGDVAYSIIGKTIRKLFVQHFPDPEQFRKRKSDRPNPYNKVVAWFGDGNTVEMLTDNSDKDYSQLLKSVPDLEKLVKQYVKNINKDELNFYMEFALHGLAEFSLVSKKQIGKGLQFKDLLSSMLGGQEFEDFEDE